MFWCEPFRLTSRKKAADAILNRRRSGSRQVSLVPKRRDSEKVANTLYLRPGRLGRWAFCKAITPSHPSPDDAQARPNRRSIRSTELL
jgi:hypothetical protein